MATSFEFVVWKNRHVRPNFPRIVIFFAGERTCCNMLDCYKLVKRKMESALSPQPPI